ncbi:MAG: rhomboid family intramembrane serine protease [Chitinophagales bacterium]|nr:rhomboid family intramembrane serine protease [Hyphomicrobiales bacterium]
MFVPLWDKNPLETVRFQFVTMTLIAINIIVFAFFEIGTFDLVAQMTSEQLSSLAVVPRELISPVFTPDAATQTAINQVASQFPEGLTLITYMFLHADWLHLGGNMLFLWVFGDNVEDAMGHLKFLVFYLLCGIFAGITHAVSQASSDVPLIGASGAVAGVIAAYLMLHPNVRVWCLVLFKIPIRLSAGFILSIWIILQIVNVVTNVGGATAWWAHIGGFIAGAVLVLFMRRPGIPLFDRGTGLAE